MDNQQTQQTGKGLAGTGRHAARKGGNLARRRRMMWHHRQMRRQRQQVAGLPLTLTININNGPQGRAGGSSNSTGWRRNRPGNGGRGAGRGPRGAGQSDERRQGQGQGKGHGRRWAGDNRPDGGRRGRTMKITTPNGYVIELTPDEAREMFPQLFQNVSGQVTGVAAESVGAPVPPQRLIRRVLKRHRIPPAQRALYKALYEASDSGLDFATLAATIGKSTEELSGVLGGLGRRVNATPGIETLPETPGVNLLFVHKESAPPNGTWGWAMSKELRAVLRYLEPAWLTGVDETGSDMA